MKQRATTRTTSFAAPCVAHSRGTDERESVRSLALASRPYFVTLLLLLTGCAQSLKLQMDAEIPTALVAKSPLSVGVHYDSEFTEHRYIEDSAERQDWDIASGTSQRAMFEQVLHASFAEVTEITHTPSAGSPASSNLNILPSIQQMQFATPQETLFPFYEAWIQYRIDLLASDGAIIDRWEFSAYGKSTKKRFDLQAEGLRNAIELALRDAGAKLSTGLSSHPAVQRMLQAQP